MSPEEWSARTRLTVKPPWIGGPAGVHGIELLQPFAGEPHAQVVIGDDRSAGRLRDLKGIAHMIAVTVGQYDVGGTLGRCLLVRDEGGITGEERVDQHGVAGEIEPESGMAKPGEPIAKLRSDNWDCGNSRLAMIARRVFCKPALDQGAVDAMHWQFLAAVRLCGVSSVSN